MRFTWDLWYETNISPENGWLVQMHFPFWMAYFQGRNVSFAEGMHFSNVQRMLLNIKDPILPEKRGVYNPGHISCLSLLKKTLKLAANGRHLPISQR